MMPGMDGLEVCRRLKGDKATAHIPVVLVTALNQPSDRMHGLDAGADGFLSKPIDEIALLARVRSLSRLRLILDELRSRALRSSKLGIGDPFTRATADNGTGGRIMRIEDSPASAELIKNALRKHHSIELEQDRGRALDSGAARDCDLFIVSLDFADCDGLRFCTRLRSQEGTRQIPVLAIANPEDRQQILRGLDLGVNDYVLRPVDRDELAARVRTQIRRKRYADCLRDNVEAAIEMAAADPLTGLKNRRCLEAHLGMLLDSLCRGPLSAMILDLDGFKAINDRYGHDAGDRVLRCFAARAKEMIRETDLLCRLGGDEFVIVMPGTVFAGDLRSRKESGRRLPHCRHGFGRTCRMRPGTPPPRSCAAPTGRSTGRNRTAAIAFQSVMRGINRGMAGWPMERLEIAERDPRSGSATLRRAGIVLPGNCPRARWRGRYRHDRRVKGSAHPQV